MTGATVWETSGRSYWEALEQFAHLCGHYSDVKISTVDRHIRGAVHMSGAGRLWELVAMAELAGNRDLEGEAHALGFTSAADHREHCRRIEARQEAVRQSRRHLG